MPSTEPLLEAEGLSVAYRGPRHQVVAVRAVSLSIDRGETLALVGETGCGKSTLALALAGLLDRDAHVKFGRLTFEGRSLRSETDWRGIRGRRLGFVFQHTASSLNPVLTIGAQLKHALVAGGTTPRHEIRERSAALLDEVGLPDPAILNSYPFQLSGGMVQRVAIAVALCNEPALLIADEATSALDPTLQRQVLDLLRDLRRRRGLSLLIVSHDMAVVRRMADRVAVMYHGAIVESGAAPSVLARPLHRYTEALLKCVPDTVGVRAGELLPVIPGTPPPAGDVIPGCPFEARCEAARPDCRVSPPLLRELEPGHWVACIHPPGGAE